MEIEIIEIGGEFQLRLTGSLKEIEEEVFYGLDMDFSPNFDLIEGISRELKRFKEKEGD